MSLPVASPAPARISFVGRIEQGLAVSVLAAMMILPILSVVTRWITGQSLAGANLWTQALNLWLAFIGAMIAARTQRHLSLSTGEIFNLSGRRLAVISAFTTAIATAVTALLAYAAADLVRAEQASSIVLPGGVPKWVIQSIMPIGFGVMALRFAWIGNRGTWGRVAAFVAVGAAFALGLVPEGERAWITWSGLLLLGGATALGAPIFTAMGGAAMLLFFTQDLAVPISAVPTETYEIVSNPSLPALPLFTLAGYLLAEGGASRRLVELFKQWFGWMPGGIAAAAITVCAFFTTFTGASGVTILALGALLLPTLEEAGYSKKFGIGLLVASGSIGLLFPPSLPVILYGVVSHVPIDQLFIAGIVPGILLVSLLVGLSVIQGIREGVVRRPFESAPALRAAWVARYEIVLPVLVLVGIFGGFLTIFEASAVTAGYAFLSEVVLHRDLGLRRDVPRVFVECATLMGGVLVILGVALGFTSYLVDAEVPMKVTAWAEAHVGSKVMFILLLNVFLLIVGCLMDIYSAIMVVVPLIAPIAAVFGVDPVHLGILFLANLELGYLTPPVGMNLFLASYRFERPLTEVYRMALPFLGVLLIGVLLIAYLPGMTLWAQDENDVESMPSFDELDEGEPQLPLGQLDLEALLNGDDDDDDSAAPAEPTPAADDEANPLDSGLDEATPRLDED